MTRVRTAVVLALALRASAAKSDVAGAAIRFGSAVEFARPPDVVATAPALGKGAGTSEVWSSACSFRHPLCVYAPSATPGARLLAALSSGERAWDSLDGALSWTPPDTDLEGPFRVYFTPNVTGGAAAVLNELDPRAHFDSATSFGLIDLATAPGCALDFGMARALASASLARAVPATDDGSACAQVEALAHLAVPCADVRGDAFEFQSHPERALVDPSSGAFDRGAALFFDWLDARFGREPGGLLLGLWALAPTRTPPGAWRWSASPTTFDVLRATLAGALSAGSTLDDVVVRFAVERARMTPAVRLAWHVAWPEGARRLASPEPVAPTGASYVVVDRSAAPPGAKLRVEAQWEDYGRMRWVVVKLDAAGRAMAEVPITSLDRGTRASLTVESLDDVDRVLIVGANVGSTEHPFNPEQTEWEPHGWLLTLAAE